MVQPLLFVGYAKGVNKPLKDIGGIPIGKGNPRTTCMFT